MDHLTKKELIKIGKEKGIPVNIGMKKNELIKTIKEYKSPYEERKELIQNDLLDQLERDGVVGEFYIDLVNDYMAMWDVKNKLIVDIEKKGVSIRYQNGENQFGYKKNDSVAELQRTNNQMLKLLDHLGLKPSKQEQEEFDYSDLEM